MHRLPMLVIAAPLMTAMALFAAGPQAPVTYGTLDNFDVINDTGGETHGFEIELEGITTSDVAYTFGAPYIRYGDPTVSLTQSGTGVIVRYAAAYDAVTHTWSAGTPVAVAPYLPTQGHSCWTGGVSDQAIYYSSGCDHFGVSLNATPTKTTYRWLVEGVPGTGTLVAFGTNVAMPAPVWNVTPPVIPGGQPVVMAALEAPAPDQFEFGDALWVKIYVTELPGGLQDHDLEHMVIDDPAVDIVPNEPAEVEFEWVILQRSAAGLTEQEFGGELGAGNESVSRRFEFYKYTGVYDPETHEALCDNPTEPTQQIPERCGDPDVNGVAGVGDLIGAQNVAINLAGEFAPSNHAPIAACQGATVAAAANVCSASASIDNGSYDRDGNPITLSQSPAGPYSLGNTSVTLTVTDDQAASATCSAPIVVYDDTPPAVESISATPDSLRPVNSKMVPVTIAVGLSDVCDSAPSCHITGVRSNEPISGIKGGDKSPDWEITGSLTVSLRAQRDRNGTGRIYTVDVECADAAANTSTTSATVTVVK